MRFAECITAAFLEDIYYDSINHVQIRRALKRLKKVLHHVLKTSEAPKDLAQLTNNVHTELKKQNALEEIDMRLLANIIEKCFRIKKRNIPIGPVALVDLEIFIVQVEQ